MNEIKLKAKLIGLHRIMKEGMEYDFEDAIDLIDIAEKYINKQSDRVKELENKLKQ